jgi:uncharacterized phage protein (TIGR01671 family)
MSLPKFRAWDKKAEVMREIKALIWEENNMIAHCPPRGHEYDEWFTVVLQGCEYQLMQSTGLKDKNGVEIFEGDIVQYTFDNPTDSFVSEAGKKVRIHPIFWSEWRASFGIGNKNANTDLFRYVRNGNTVKVIGTIWANPELLEESQ